MKNVLKTMTAAASVAAGMMFLAADVFATGTSAAQFLKLGAGARAEGMGEAFSAVANDVTAVYWNPAGLAQIETPEIGAMQNTHFVDTQYQFLSGVKPFGSNVFGLSVYRLDYGSIDAYDKDNVKQGSFDAASMAVSLSMGRKINEQLMLGGSMKMVEEAIENEKASSFAADFGVMYKLDKYNLSGVIQHVGPGMKMVKDSAPLPMTVRVGASRRFMSDRMLAAVEVSKPNDSNASLHGGLEYQLMPLIAMRGGYKLTPGQSTDLGGLVGLNAGLGITFNRFNLDYSIAPFGDLGLSHRFSFGYKFGAQTTY